MTGRLVLALALGAAIAVAAGASRPAAAQVPFIGQIQYFPYNFAPRSWTFCNGQLLPISQNTALFSLLGTTFGGDGRVTFALPDMRGRIPMALIRYEMTGYEGDVEKFWNRTPLEDVLD